MYKFCNRDALHLVQITGFRLSGLLVGICRLIERFPSGMHGGMVMVQRLR